MITQTFLLHLKTLFKEKGSECFNCLQSVTTGHTVAQFLFEQSGSQSVTQLPPGHWTVSMRSAICISISALLFYQFLSKYF